MTQVSLYGNGLENEIHVEDNLSVLSDDDQDERIKEVLQVFGDETFDYDSADNSSHGGSRSSSVNNNNNNSFLSNKDNSQVFTNGKVNDIDYSSILKGVNLNLNMLPNAVTDGSENRFYPAFGNGVTGGSENHPYPFIGNGKLNGFSTTPATNGHPSFNGNHINGSLEANVTKPKKQVTIVDTNQKNRDHEEIEESNPTISLLHKDHCPRNENGGHVSEELWLEAGFPGEQRKDMLAVRQRQIQRCEEEISKLQKDNRSKNHQIGLMKTEMIQIKKQEEKAEEFARMKEQQCEYLDKKLREAIEEYEKAKRGEIEAKDEVSHLNTEIDKLKQEVQLLSSIGSSTQQAELNDVVRQLREKHAADFVSWKKVVAELEGQLRTHKRQQQLLLEESFTGTKQNATSQTDEVVEVRSEFLQKSSNIPEFKRKEKTQFAIIEEDDDVLIKEKKIISLNEKFEELKREFQEEKNQIIDAYEREIDQYRHRLATLPNELYRKWEETQKELGLQAYVNSKPIHVDAFTSPDEDIQGVIQDTSTANPFGTKTQDTSELYDAAVQVNFPSLLANRESKTLHDANISPGSHRDVSSILVQTEDKETSNAVIQTDETLETYKILAQLLEAWSTEIQTAKANEDEMTLKCREFEEELNKFRKQFKLLQKVATKCRKESKKREDTLKQQNSEMKARYMEVLQKLNEKLDILA